MNVWKLLGIEKTADIRTIKKAYAKMLKVYNPEDDPEGFMRLRQAYEEAIKQTKDMDNKESKREPYYEDNRVLVEDSLPNPQEFYENDCPQHEQGQLTNDKKLTRYEKAEALYNDIFKRREVSCWQELFSEMTIDEYQYLNENAWVFFNTNCCLPYDVWKLIDSEFSVFEDPRFKWTKLVQYDFGLSFDIFDQGISVDYPSFARLRFIGFVCFVKGNYKESVEYLKEAGEIFDNDPLIYRLKGISYYYLQNYDDAIKELSQVLSLDGNNLDTLLFRGNAYIKKSEFKKAVADFFKAVKIDKDNFDAYKGIIKSLYGIKEYGLVDQYLDRFRKRYPKVDVEIGVLVSRREKERLSNKLKNTMKMSKVLTDKVLKPDSPLGSIAFIILVLLGICVFFTVFISPIGPLLGAIVFAYYIKKNYNK